MFVQKAYGQKHGRLPIDDGIDVISVNALAFKRFLEIAKRLNKTVAVVTDNDGSCSRLKKKYEEYLGDSASPNIKIFYDEDEQCATLEPQIVKYNDLTLLNRILGTEYKDKEALVAHMLDNKTDCALRIFESTDRITIPPYVEKAIE